MTPTSDRAWVLYDDHCGFCRRWVPFWESILLRHGMEIAPLQAEWVRARLKLPAGEVVQDLRLLLPDGNHLQGADVYRYAMRQIWWAYPLFLLASAPLLRAVFDAGYRTFARNRYRISRACGLPGGGRLTLTEGKSDIVASEARARP